MRPINLELAGIELVASTGFCTLDPKSFEIVEEIPFVRRTKWVAKTDPEIPLIPECLKFRAYLLHRWQRRTKDYGEALAIAEQELAAGKTCGEIFDELDEDWGEDTAGLEGSAA
jgi:hypothetical protein